MKIYKKRSRDRLCYGPHRASMCLRHHRFCSIFSRLDAHRCPVLIAEIKGDRANLCFNADDQMRQHCDAMLAEFPPRLRGLNLLGTSLRVYSVNVHSCNLN